MGDKDADHQTGKRFGYGLWLQPIINANDRSSAASGNRGETPSPPPPQRRGRGRPPVIKPRSDSAIEKRRAQVREAQRTYQKRKDTATAAEKRRADDLLQLLSDLSSDVESLLQAASTAGNMNRDDDVSKNIQRLWSTYDSVINNECIKPELRLHQIKNHHRLESHKVDSSLRNDDVSNVAQVDTNAGVVPSRNAPFDPSAMSFQLVRFEETTVMSSYQRTPITDQYMAGRSIYDIVQERQTAMKDAERRRAEQTNQDQ